MSDEAIPVDTLRWIALIYSTKQLLINLIYSEQLFGEAYNEVHYQLLGLLNLQYS